MTSNYVGHHIDLALIALYVFWVAFAILIWYLQTESRREGYPLLHNRRGQHVVVNPRLGPPAKSFNVAHEGVVVPHTPERDLASLLAPTAMWPGAPHQPLGNPMQDGVGPASWAMRADKPDMTHDDHSPKIVPLRAAPAYSIDEEDPNPIGFDVVTADGMVAGRVVDIWIDKSETIVRYLEAEA